MAKVPGFASENLSIIGRRQYLRHYAAVAAAGASVYGIGARRAARVILLGSSIADALFPGQEAVGRSALIDGTEYQVVGVFEPAKGGFFGENGQDSQVTMPL